MGETQAKACGYQPAPTGKKATFEIFT